MDTIHLHARKEDTVLIDSVASLMGIDRSQFLLNVGVQAAKDYILDQTTFHVDIGRFNAVLDWMDEPYHQNSGIDKLQSQKSFD